MRRSLRGFAGWSAAALLATAALTVPSFAAGQFNPPSVSVVSANRSSITLRLTAGPSGAPAGVYVEWMKTSDFNITGWLYDPYDARLVYCDFSGTPTWHTSSTGSYALGPGQSVDVVVGELFDETGVSTDFIDEMSAGEQIVIHALTNGSGTTAPSDYSADLFSASGTTGSGCTFTQGYWKTHGSGACHSGNNINAWPVASLTIGTRIYTAAELCSILNTPAGGNALLILFHQLIAAKLNALSGADNACISATISAADAAIGGLVPPPVGADNINSSSALGTQLVGYANTLDTYNNGLLCSPHCDTPTRKSSWGQLKTLYR